MVENLNNKVVIETPEKIYFTYTLAEVGTRAAAYVLDLLIQGLIIIILALLGFFSFINTQELEDQLYLAFAVMYILIFLFQWFYFVFFETVLNGSTPGKTFCKIKVIRADGDRLDITTIALRNLLRAADSVPFPVFSVLGGFVALLNKKNRRLGDIASGTIVVLKEDINITEPDFKANISNNKSRDITKLKEANRLSEKDLYIIRKVLNEKEKNPSSAYKSAEIIVNKLSTKYDLEYFKGRSNYYILEEIYKAHTYEN